MKRHVEIFDAEGEADDEGMERNRHHSSLSCTLRVQRIELIADHLIPILGCVAALEDHADIIQPLLVRNTDHAA